MKAKIICIFVMALLITTALTATGVMNVKTKEYVNEKNYCKPYPITPVNSPSLITIKIEAKVAYVDDRSNLLGGAIKVGDTITGKYIYDSETPDTNSGPTVGDYWHTSPSCGIEVKAGGFVFTTDPSDVNFLVEICNDHGSPTPRDNYLLRSYNNLPLSNHMLVDHISWQLDDDTCTALSSDALPTTPPILEDWESIFGLTLTGSNSSDPYQDYFIRAHVTKATKTKVRDAYGAKSDLATLRVNIQKNKVINTPFLSFLQNFIQSHPNLFLILQKIIQRVRPQ